jgi:hypothetical protein
VNSLKEAEKSVCKACQTTRAQNLINAFCGALLVLSSCIFCRFAYASVTLNRTLLNRADPPGFMVSFMTREHGSGHLGSPQARRAGPGATIAAGKRSRRLA